MCDHDDGPSRGPVTRRSLLAGVAGLAASTATVATGSAAVGSVADGGDGTTNAAAGGADADAVAGPVAARGRRTQSVRVDGDALVHEERFVAPLVEQVYGHEAVTLESFRTPTDRLPDGLDPPEAAISRGYDDWGVFGTPADHAAAEGRIRARLGRDGGATGDGPVYQYARGALPDGDVVAERKAPVNVAWDRSLTLSPGDVERTMTDAGWDSLVALSGHRYLLVPAAGGSGDGRRLRREDHHVKRQVAPWSTAQYHARLWSLPDGASNDAAGGRGVVGSAHFDPWLHGLAADAPAWRFDAARRAVATTWREAGHDATLVRARNGTGFGGARYADGRVAVVGR